MNTRDLIRYLSAGVWVLVILGVFSHQAEAWKWQAVTTGTGHTCGLKDDGTIICWGDNSNKQILSPSGTFAFIDAGEFYNCAVKINGGVDCWVPARHRHRPFPPPVYPPG
jgi:hypothetical protein